MTKPKKHGLLSKLLAFLLPFTLISIAGTAVVISYVSYIHLDQTIRRDYENIIERSAGEIGIFMDGAKKHLKSLATVMTSAKLSRWEKEMALTAFQHENPEFDFADLVSKNADNNVRTIFSRSIDKHLENTLMDRAFSGTFAASGVMRGHHGLPVIFMAVPIKRQGRVEEVLRAQLNLKAIWDVLKGIRVGENGQVYIMDLSGGYVAHRQMDRVVRTPPDQKPDILDRLQQRPGNTIEWIEEKPEGNIYHIGAVVGDYDWVVALSQPVSEIYVFLYRNGLWAALITAFSVALAVFLAWRQSRRLLTPVSELHRQVLAMSEGDLDAKVNINTNDETEALGRAFNDMTDALKIHIAREVEQTRALMHAKNLAALGTASSKITHELGNFLNNADMVIAGLKREPLSASGEKMLGILEREAGQVKTFIRTFLDFARKPELRMEPRSFAPLIRDAAASYEETAAKAGVAISLDFPENPAPVAIDSRLMAQVASNLIKNAIDAMPDGGTLSIAARQTDGAVEVTFSDTGEGLDRQTAERIFEPFFTTKSRDGTGLGLAIAENIVEAHRGTIECRSAPGEGTAFVIRLPVPPTQSLPQCLGEG